VSGGDVVRRDDLTQVMETWGIQQTVEYDSTCIEASIYGQSLLEASRAKLEESAGKVERSAVAAARILLSAALMGHFDLADRFESRLAELIREDGDFASVTGALNALLYLYRYDDVLGSARQAAAASLLHEAYQRGLWLVESLSGTQIRQDTPEGIKLLRETLERCPALGLDREEFVEVFSRVAANAVSPTLRGASVGVLWSLAALDASSISLPLTANPEDLGDFLTGLLLLAKSALQRHPDLVRQIGKLVGEFGDEQFLVALPPLRLAFSVFTPREKDNIAAALFGQVRKISLAVPGGVAAQVLAWEGRLFAEMERYGVKR
ncbi:MAG TPA: DUF5682 family protein, partial [Gemmatimonadaceae bacterium]|nr:DUF5682 family protein [Gemmatimonadaceae bacterium]